MNLRRCALAIVAIAALLLPTAAAAADVHITIGLKHVMRNGERKLKVSGVLHDVGGGATCTDGRHLVVQRRKNASSKWNAIAHISTNDSAVYKKVVRDRTGQYRVVAPASGSCEKDVSDKKGHSH